MRVPSSIARTALASVALTTATWFTCAPTRAEEFSATRCQYDARLLQDMPAWVQKFASDCDPSQNKITYGDTAERGTFSWVASVGNTAGRTPVSSHHCGGVVFRNNWVITARHCVDQFNRTQLRVVTGTHHLHDEAQQDPVEKIILPATDESLDGDIALLKLPDRTRPSIDHISTEQEEQQIRGAENMVLVSGWGPTFLNGGTVDYLQYASFRYEADHNCRAHFDADFELKPDHVCAGAWGEPRQQLCKGDSGGGLVWRDGDENMLLGLVARGRQCGGYRSQLDIFTRVSVYLEWILECTGNSERCVR